MEQKRIEEIGAYAGTLAKSRMALMPNTLAQYTLECLTEIEYLQKERAAATAVVDQAIQWLTPHPGDGSRAVEKARIHLMKWRGLED